MIVPSGCASKNSRLKDGLRARLPALQAARLKSDPMHLFMALAMFAATAPEAVVLKPVANMYAQPAVDTEVVSQAI